VLAGRGLSVWLLCLTALLLFFFGAQVNPVVFMLAGVLVPLPVLLAGWRLGGRGALLLALVTALAIFALKPGLEVVWANLGFGSLLLMGVLLTALKQRGAPPPRAIILTVAALSVSALLLLLGQAFYLGVSPPALLAQKSSEIMATVQQVLGGAGTGSSSLMPGVAQADLEALLRRLLPGLVVANTGLVAWLNVILARQIAFFLRWGEPEPPLFYWATPEWLIFVVLGTGFLLLIPVTQVRTLSLNLLLVLALLYFCQGVAVVAAWFHRLSLPRFLRVIGYPLLFLNPFFFLIITLGLMDLWLDFRRLHRPRDA
jgi:uncharacterized protein YybS (DUF2232 family)